MQHEESAAKTEILGRAATHDGIGCTDGRAPFHFVSFVFPHTKREKIVARYAEEDGDHECNKAYDRAEDELGDFLFATVNAARLYGLNPDTALERTCAKFRRRFTYLEEQTIRQGRNLTDMTLAEMDAIWDEGKAKGL